MVFIGLCIVPSVLICLAFLCMSCEKGAVNSVSTRTLGKCDQAVSEQSPKVFVCGRIFRQSLWLQEASLSVSKKLLVCKQRNFIRTRGAMLFAFLRVSLVHFSLPMAAIAEDCQTTARSLRQQSASSKSTCNSTSEQLFSDCG